MLWRLSNPCNRFKAMLGMQTCFSGWSILLGNFTYVGMNYCSFYLKLISSYSTCSSVSLLVHLIIGVHLEQRLQAPRTDLLVLWHFSKSFEACTVSTDLAAPPPRVLYRSGSGVVPAGTLATCCCTETTACWTSQLFEKPSSFVMVGSREPFQRTKLRLPSIVLLFF